MVNSPEETLLQLMREKQERFDNRVALRNPVPAEAQQRTIDYWTKVFETRPASSGLLAVRSMAQQMDYQEARKKFWGILERRAAEIMVNEDPNFEWVFCDQTKRIVQNMIRYFINDRACEWPLNKGLFLYGQPGTGKTEFMSAFSRFTNEIECTMGSNPEFVKQFTVCSMSSLYDSARTSGIQIESYYQFDRCFDELGRKSGSVVSYGNPIDVNESIIENRYNRYKNYGQITHFIANATPADIQTIFSSPVIDRLRSMCTPVLMPGQSKRI